MIIIIGAGLSGLLLGYRLKNAGIPFKILEARKRIGGRIQTVKSVNKTPVEMGATWFHHEHRNFFRLLGELEIPFYEQYMEGTAFFQARAGVPAESFIMPDQEPSYRIGGGSQALVEKLASHLDPEDILLGQSVDQIRFSEDEVEVQAEKSFSGEKVVLALPPKLWQETIRFSPELPTSYINVARETQTWMEDSIKVGLVYESPFWRNKEYSGTLFSNVGPMTELYDHCNKEASTFALCGFMHPNYKSLSQDDRKNRIIEQLVSSLGIEAQEVLEYLEQDWSQEPHTSGTHALPLFPHQNNGHEIYEKSLFGERLYFSGTESSPLHGGYMEGAVYSSIQVFAKLLRSHNPN